MHRRGGMTAWWPAIVIAGLLGASLPSFAQAPQEADEYEAKVAFVYAFAKFVNWPDVVGDTPFTIGVLGAADVLGPMRTLQGKRVHRRAVEVHHLTEQAPWRPCDVLFCSTAELQALLGATRDAAHDPMLTVGDEEGFAAAGGVLQLTFVDEHLGFIVNRAAARRAGLDLSSSVFNLAIRVIDNDGLDPQP